MTPVYDLKWAQTLDGQLSDDHDSSRWISSTEERVETHRVRRAYDAVLVGAGTFLADLCRLTVREVPRLAHEPQPVRIFVDPRGRIAARLTDEALKTELLANAERPTLLLSPICPLAAPGLVHVPFTSDLATRNGLRDLDEALREGAQVLGRPLEGILVEGGATLLAFFLRQGHYRKAYVSISPQMTGGARNRIRTDFLLSEARKHTIEALELFGSDVRLLLEPCAARAEEGVV